MKLRRHADDGASSQEYALLVGNTVAVKEAGPAEVLTQRLPQLLA